MELVERVEHEMNRKKLMYTELQESPIDLDELYRGIVGAVHHDYVGFERKRRYFMPNESRTYVLTNYRYGTLTMQMLARSLERFAEDMHDRNLRFYCDDWIDYKNLAVKYEVRAYGEFLYVTKAAPETGLVPGDKIVTVQRKTPEATRQLLRGSAFYSSVQEREIWDSYLKMAPSLEVEHRDGTSEHMRLPLWPEEKVERQISFQTLEKNTAYLRAEYFDSAAINRILEEHTGDIAHAQKLIIDLRRCAGGEEDALYGLLPYIVDKDKTMEEIYGDTGSFALCTENNCERRYSVLSAFRETLTDKDEIEILNEEMTFWRDNYGKGLVFCPPEPVDGAVTAAEQAPDKVLILTDTRCENEGERFVDICGRCGGKVSVIGRPTMGTLDTFDCITLALNDHMRLSYPIRETTAAHDGKGISEIGIQPDIYVPWTPDEIDTDVILRTAMSL